MWNFTKKMHGGRDGFTLIEVLIVIFIVSLLALVAISNYGAVRQSIRVSIATDQVVSLFKESRDQTRAGRTSTDEKETRAQCVGLKFEAGKALKKFQTPYVRNVKTCDLKNAREVKSFDEINDVLLQKIMKGSQSVSKIAVVYKPPFGEVKVVDDVTFAPVLVNTFQPAILQPTVIQPALVPTFQIGAQNSQKIEFVMGVGAETSGESRKIILNPLTGSVTVTK